MYILNYRVSIFGDYKEYVPNAEYLTKWTQMFSDSGIGLLPTIIEASTITIQGPLSVNIINPVSLPTEKRMRFVSSDNSISVQVLSDRIDVECGITNTADMEGTLSQNMKLTNQLATLILAQTNKALGNRLAYFVDLMIPDKNGSMLNPFYLNNNLGFDEESKLAEWAHKFNIQKEIKIHEKLELCNMLFNFEAASIILQQQEKGKQVKGLHITGDINTLFENPTYRFDIQDLVDFCKQAQDKYLDYYHRINKFFII